MEIKAFWDNAPCSLVEVDRRFRCSVDLIMEAIHTPEMSVCYETTRHNIPEGFILQMSEVYKFVFKIKSNSYALWCSSCVTKLNLFLSSVHLASFIRHIMAVQSADEIMISFEGN
jgi:hypothetical protein